MSIDNRNTLQLTERGNKLVKAAKNIGVTAIATTVTAIPVVVIANLAGGPEMHGEKTVHVNPGDTLDTLIDEHVDGGESYTGKVRVEVKQDPDNADVFENNQLDPGEQLKLPEHVG